MFLLGRRNRHGVDIVSEAATAAGARRLYDYQNSHPQQIDGDYDAILATSASNLSQYRRLLRPGGRIAALSPDAVQAILASVVNRGPLIKIVSGKPNAADLEWLTQRVDDGALKPIIAAMYPLDRVADAHRDAENESAQGKRVVTIDS